MLRNRNSFFQEASMSTQNYMPDMNMNMGYPMMNQVPMSAAQASQSYYSGPVLTNPANYNNFDDYEARLAKLERQINRLDARISKLENSSKLESVDISSNMYMV
ncbi:MAG: hypothetical protein IJ572_04335 [Bacilli bacterium]|nr:hypothetical protein [Bacilli bacterium]